MRKSRIIGVLAVEIDRLGSDGDDSHDNSNETILKNANPDDLERGQLRQSGVAYRRNREKGRTLNQVRPLRGFRHIPFCPPVHFCIHGMGHTQFMGSMCRKYSFCVWTSGAMYWQSRVKNDAMAKGS